MGTTLRYIAETSAMVMHHPVRRTKVCDSQESEITGFLVDSVNALAQAMLRYCSTNSHTT
jgi:hypothetical protein